MKYSCQCCGYKTFENGGNSFKICEVCFWQTCPIGNVEATTIVGPNPISLVEAQHNFISFGACDEALLDNVRKPKTTELKDENLKIFDIRIQSANEIFNSKLILWMNYDLGIEKIRNISLKVQEKIVVLEKEYEDFERMLYDLQMILPENHKIETCFFCKFSNYNVAGNDNFGDLNCFKNCKEVLKNVQTKHDIIDAFANGKDKIIKVEETHFCEEFEKYSDDDYVIKMQIKN